MKLYRQAQLTWLELKLCNTIHKQDCCQDALPEPCTAAE